jgi:arylsulfatase
MGGMMVGPNILWLFTDQHRADVIGAAGHPVVHTPNLDALAARGTSFDGAYCMGPLCMPSRTSLLTGRYVRDHGVANNRTELAGPLPTIVQSIRDAGYYTAAVGKMHLYPHRASVADGLDIMHGYGFDYVNELGGKLASSRVSSSYTDYLAERGLLDTYRNFVRRRAPHLGLLPNQPAGRKPTWTVDPTPLPADAYIDNFVGDRAVSWIDEVDTERPFFLWVGFPGPHDLWDAPAEYVEQYRDADIELDSTTRPEVPKDGPLKEFLETFLAYSSSPTLTDERAIEVRRHYFANVTLIDAAIGRIIDALRRRGLDEDTWIVYSTDHGEMLGTHGLLNKMVFYEPSVRVPLIIRPPGGGQARRFTGLVEHLDLSTTLVELAGGKPVPDSPGRSLTGLVDSAQRGKFVVASATTNFPRCAPGREVVVSENFGFGLWRTERYKLVAHEARRLPVQLFDLAEDPGEDQNQVDDPARRHVVADLMDAYVHPFLDGPPRS